MKIPEALDVVLTAITLCGVGAVCVSCTTAHPRPHDEIYEVRDPGSNRTVMRIQNTRWTDGRTKDYCGTIKFKQSDGSVFSIFLVTNDPNYWSVEYCPPGGESEKIGLTRIYGPSVFPLNFFDKCWVEEGESFDK